MASDEDEYPTAGEHAAFCETRDIVDRLIEKEGFASVEVADGVLVAALYALRRAWGNKRVAEKLYEAADDYAVRDEADNH